MVKVLRYNQTKLNILHEIASMNLKKGDMLPSERTLSAKLGISMGTLRRALSELEEQLIIRKEHGRGSILQKRISNDKNGNQIALIYIKRINNSDLPDLGSFEIYLNDRGISLQYIPVMRFDKTLISEVEKCFAVLVTGWLDSDWIKNLQLLNKPMVAVGSHQYSNLLPWVSYDWGGAASMVTSRLIARKAKRIGLLNGGHRYYPSTLIYQGYKRAITAAGLKLDENLISWATREETWSKVEEFIINKLPELDAVVLELGTYYPFLSLCWSMGIQPDKPLGVIGGGERHSIQSGNVIQAIFEENIYITAAKVFLEALRNDDKFKGEFIINAKLV